MYGNQASPRTLKQLNILANRKTFVIVLSYIVVFTLGLLSQGSLWIPLKQFSEKAAVKCTCAPSRVYDDGWHSIEVFYGTTEFFLEQQAERQELKQSPSPDDFVAQVQQDIIVSRLFRNMTQGYFIELAANNAVWISNTYALERKFNWTGLCIEPNPEYWSDLAHRDCQVVAAVVGENRLEPVHFHYTGFGPGGGIVGDEYDNHNIEGSLVKYTVPLQEVLVRFQAPKEMDYLSLDVEGAESLIMRHFPFHEYSFKVLSVERPKEDLQALLMAYGYELLGIVGTFGETIWLRSDIKDTLDLDSIVEFLNRE